MNTYTDAYLHIIFGVKYRDAVLDKSWREQLFSYIAGIINNNGHIAIIVGGVEDHIHCLLKYNPNQTIADLVKEIKGGSSFTINNKRLIGCKFAWQKGYGAFSYSRGQIPAVKSYIARQEEHHRKQKFRDELVQILEDRKIAYNSDYVYDELE